MSECVIYECVKQELAGLRFEAGDAKRKPSDATGESVYIYICMCVGVCLCAWVCICRFAGAGRYHITSDRIAPVQEGQSRQGREQGRAG